MKNVNKLEYVLLTNNGETRSFPLGEKNFRINFDKNGISYDRNLSGTVVFRNESFEALMEVERSQNKCKDVNIEIYKACDKERKLVFSTNIDLNSASYDLDKCIIEAKFAKEDLYFCFNKRKNVEVDLFEKIEHEERIRFVENNAVFEEVVVNFSRNSNAFWRGYTKTEFARRIPSGYTGQNYAVKKWKAETTLTPSGMLYDVRTDYEITLIRKVVEIDCLEEVPSNYIMASDNCVNSGTRTYYVEPVISESSFTRLDEIPLSANSGTYIFIYEAKFIGVDGFEISMDNGMKFNDVLLAMMSDCFTEIRSDFFQLNVPPEEQTEINYITGRESYVNNLILFQRSDVVRYEDNFENATKAVLKLKDLFEWLSSTFNVGYGLVNGVLRIEHEDFFRNLEEIDLTTDEFKKYINKKRKYTYDSFKFPAFEDWTFDVQGSELWNENEINYLDCNISETDLRESFKVENMTTDVSFLLEESKKEDVGSDILKGFVLMSGKRVSEKTSEINSMNSNLSWFRLISDFHFYNRPQKFGQYMEREVEFKTTSLSLIGEVFTIPFCLCDDFNVFASYITELGKGQINTAEISLINESLTLEIAYPYDLLQEEGSKKTRPELISENSVMNYGDILQKIINATDEDGVVTSVEIVTYPTNGQLTIINDSGTFYFQYVGNVGYLGNDIFQLKAVDNDGLESYPATFEISVVEENSNGYPILKTEIFSSAWPQMGVEYYAGNVLANDEANSTLNELTVIDFEQVPFRLGEASAVFRIEPNGDFFVTFVGCPHSFQFSYTAINDDGFQATQNSVFKFLLIEGRPC